MGYTPDKGDIIHLQFDPASGKEMQGNHFALVLSTKIFNKHDLAFVCPISQGQAASARTFGTVVTLMGSGTETQGAVHCHQLKSLDWKQRKAKLKERVPSFIVDDVIARVQSILTD